MSYSITIKLDGSDIKDDDARSIANYLDTVLKTTGYGYSIDCFNEKQKIMSSPTFQMTT